MKKFNKEIPSVYTEDAQHLIVFPNGQRLRCLLKTKVIDAVAEQPKVRGIVLCLDAENMSSKNDIKGVFQMPYFDLKKNQIIISNPKYKAPGKYNVQSVDEYEIRVKFKMHCNIVSTKEEALKQYKH